MGFVRALLRWAEARARSPVNLEPVGILYELAGASV